MLRPVHGPAGLHSGYGSCFRYPPFSRYLYAPLSGRQACPVLLEGGSSPGPPRLFVPLPGARDCRQPGEVKLRSVSDHPISRRGDRCTIFFGFSIARLRLQAAINSRRISVLRCAACELMAVSAGDVVLSVPSCPRRLPGHAVPPTVPSQVLGLGGSLGSGVLDSGMSLDLRWWLQVDCLTRGVSLRQVRPDLDFWSDASDVGGGAHLGTLVVSCLWDEADFSEGERQRASGGSEGSPPLPVYVFGATVAVFCNNVTAVAYLHKVGGIRSPFLNDLAQEILRWAESLNIRLAPQFIPGIRNVLADSLSWPHQLPSSEWSLNMGVFLSLQRQWPVMIDLFATSDNRRCSLFLALPLSLSTGTDALLQSWDGLQAYAFPPWSILPQGVEGCDSNFFTPYWPQRPWFTDLIQMSVAPPVVLPNCPDLLFQPQSRQRYPGLHRLALHAWKLSGGSPERRVSPLL